MKVAIVRGAFLNRFECQNYEPLHPRQCQITFFGSKNPIHTHFSAPLVQLWSPMDLHLPKKVAIANRLFGNSHYLLGLEKHLRGFDIVHTAETYYRYTLQAINAKRRGNVRKVITTCWETIPHNNESLASHVNIKQQAYRFVDHFVCPTVLAKNVLCQEGVNHKRISVIPFGVDQTQFYPNHQPDLSIPKILFVGRLSFEKGADILLYAFAQLLTLYPKAKLKIIGQGSKKKMLIQLAHRLNLQTSVSFESHPYSAIPSVYRWANIFCLPAVQTPTIREQYGMVLVEALSSGLPVVATNTGSISEVLNNTGTIISHPDLELLTSALIQTYKKLLHNPSHMQLITKYAQSRFNCTHVAQTYYSLYQQVLA